MRKTTQKVYDRIDNRIYETQGDSWRLPESFLSCIKISLNPVRVSYIKRHLRGGGGGDRNGRKALEVGCGGGLLTEEIALLGFDTWGVDPSSRSIAAAELHARARGLRIHYREGVGESLPYPDGFFDAVFCCDVLEHVRDPERVVAEASRVLKTGGIFHYGTFNRTRLAKLVMIKVAQQWSRWAFMPPDVHVWEMFIKPREMKGLLKRGGLAWREHRGVGLELGPLKTLGLLRRRARGELSMSAFAETCVMSECGNTSVMYMGYAVKE